MDVFLNLLKWGHLGALIFSLGTATAASMIGINAVRAGADGARLWSLQEKTEPLINAAVAVLLVTGVLMLWLRYNFDVTHWFWLKMLLLAGLIATVIFEARFTKRAREGDAAAGQSLGRITVLAVAVELGIVLAAIFAFN